MIASRDPILRTRPLARPPWLPEGVWPFESVGLELDDSLLALTDVGHGPPLLFVHVGTWSFLWRDLLARLATEFRCICFDAPGTGRSEDRTGSEVSLDRAARAVAGVIERLDLDEITIVAHDLGGPAGLAGIALAPERVRGMVAMNAFGWKPSGLALRAMMAVVGSALARELDVLTGLVPRVTATSFGVGRHLDGSSRRAFRAGMGPGARRAFHGYMHDARRCDELYGRAERALAGPLSRLPLLTVFGERNDPFGFQRRWKALFPDLRQVVVAGGNHFPMCDAPDLVAGAIRSWHRESVAPGASTCRARAT